MDLLTVLSNTDYRFLVDQEVAEAGRTGSRISLEPSPSNTDPANAVAALLAATELSNAVAVVTPFDHAIRGDFYQRALADTR